MAIPFVSEFDDLAEAIADPNPNRPIQNATGQFGQKVCDAISNNPGLYAPTILQWPLKAVCQPYWDDQGYDAPVVDVPFTGGQCAGVAYTVTWSITETLCSSGPVNRPQPNRTVIGPIARAKTEINPGSNPTVEFRFGTAGSTLPIQGSGSYIDPCFADVTSALDWGTFVAVRQDGLPDTCGDPPGDVVPGPNPAPDPGPLPPDTGPSFDIRGNPIFVLPPTLEVSPDFNIDVPIGEINLGSGTGNGPAAPPAPGEESPGEGTGEGGGDNDFPEPPDGERWVGCCVTITATPPGAGAIPQAEPQSIYPTTIGNVRLRFRGFSGGSEYDTPVVNRQKTTCVWEPVRGLEPVGVRVNLLPGYSYSYRPYSVPQEQ